MSSEGIYKNLWVVDPLDGTANYSRSIPLCCVSIAYVIRCQTSLGRYL
jgi:myo-inositol-1(or 4)-monophosphatase